MRPFVDANIQKSEAGDRVQKLQQALNILGDTEGPEVDGLRASIEARRDSSPGRARRQAGEGLRGVLVQGASTSGGTRTEAVCGRSQHQCCRAEVGNSVEQDCTPPPPPDTTAEVQRLQDLVSHLQAQVRGGDPDMPCGPVAKRPCRSAQGRVPGGAIPAELSAWLEERHADLHDALVNGDNGRVLELTSLLSEGAERLVELIGSMCP